MELLKKIFFTALEQESDVRDAFLGESCAGDLELRKEVEALLVKHEDGSDFMSGPLDVPVLKYILEHEKEDPNRNEESDLHFEHIGDFRLIRKLGEGGMGVVYEAEQLSLKRRVALKVLPAHLGFSDEAIRKFYREAEAGGRQSHPGIVAVHAVGEFKGTHYIAQELVADGANLFQRLDELKKTREQHPGYFREVARMVAAVAGALQHAHESGVIHRDIKPSNILLDVQGFPKVTDFGLAKVEDALALSRTGDFAGTPYYMSPEQAMSRRIGIDHRTDIYSLGVTLYEMLTLRRPFDGETSQDVLKKIVLLDPVLPHKANPRIPRDLSTICLKTMEKVPDNRYQSMHEFADDLCRFLSGDAILAKPPGLRIRVWKRFKRNPAASAGLGVAVLAVLASCVIVPWVVVHSKTREKRAEELIRNAEANFGFLCSIIKDAFDPRIPDNAKFVEQVLDCAAERIDGVFQDAPIAVARVRRTLGEAYQRIKKWEKASLQYTRAIALSREYLGEQHRETLKCLLCQACNLFYWRSFDEAERVLREYLPPAQESLGLGDSDVFRAVDLLTQILREKFRTNEAIQLLQKRYNCLREAYGEQDRMTLKGMCHLAVFLTSEYDKKGFSLLKECLDKQQKVLDRGDLDIISSLRCLANLAEMQGEYHEQWKFRSELHEIISELYGPENREALKEQICLTEAIDRTGRLKDAEQEYREVLKECEKHLDENDQDTSLARCNLAVFLTRRGRLAEAESLHRDSLRARVQACPGDQSVPWSKHCLAETLRRRGNYEEARNLHREGLRESEAQANSDMISRFLDEVARLFEDMEDHGEAERYLDYAIEITSEVFRNRPHPRIAKVRLDKGCYLNRQRRYDEAKELLRMALDIFKNTTPKHYNCFVTASALGMTRAGQGRFEEAEKLLLDAHEGLERIHCAYYADEGPAAVERLVKLYELWKRPDQAEQWQTKLARLQEIKEEMARGDYSHLPTPPE